VTGQDDDVDDGDQSYSIELANAVSSDGIYNGLDPADVAVLNIDDDTAGFDVVPLAISTTEALGTDTFAVKLTSEPTDTVTVGVSSSNTGEGTVDKTSLTFTSIDWDIEQTVTVTGVNDYVSDSDQSYTIVLTSSSADTVYAGIDPDDVSATNVDDDSPGFLVGTISGNTTEAGGTATFTVELNTQPGANVSVAISSSSTAAGTVSPGILTFTAGIWNSPQTVTVTGVDDDVDDGDQSYTIVLAAATSTDLDYNGLDPSDVSVVNVDNDTAGFDVGAISGDTTEGGGTATFTVKLTSEPLAGVAVGVSSADTGEGVADTASLTFTAADWNIDQTVTVTGVDDDVVDGDQNFSIELAAAVSTDGIYNGLDPADVAVLNMDDDTAGFVVGAISGDTTEGGGTATFTVKLTSEPLAGVAVGLSSTDTSEGIVNTTSLTFTAADWNIDRTVTVTGQDDDVDDGDQAYSIELAAAVSADGIYNGLDPADVVVLNMDDDTAGFVVGAISGDTTEAGGAATFTVKLTSRPLADVAVGVSSGDASEGIVNTTSLTFTAADWNIDQTVTVTGQDDDVDDGDQGYSIELAPAVSTDGIYNGLDPADVSVMNIDDDVAGFDVSAISGDTTEAGGTATFTVKLTSEPLFDVTIGVSSSDQTEGLVQPTDPTSLTFTASDWNIDQTVTVTGQDDAVSDGPVSYTIVLDPAVSTDSVYSGMDPADVAVVNIDDDSPGFLVGTISGDTTEAGGTATFTVKLNTQPGADVSIAVSSSNIAEGTVSLGILTFTTGIWNTPQAVTVTGEDDDVDDGDQSYTIVLAAATSADLDYNGLDPSDVSVVNVDDDTAGFDVSAISNDTTEAGGTATFTVSLTSKPLFDVTIAVSSDDTTEGTVDKASLTLTDADWNVGQAVTVTGQQDPEGDIADLDQTYTVVLAAASSADGMYDGVDPADVTVVNLDDENLAQDLNCTDGGSVECVERADPGIPGTDADNLNVSVPRFDIAFEFTVDVTDNSGMDPQYVRLYMAQRGNPSTSEWYSYDLTNNCTGDFLAGATCSYVTILGPAATHKYYYEMMAADGTTVTRYPTSGYLTGPTVHLLTGYNLVSIPRDTSASNLGGNAAFGTANSYRWDGALGYYTQVTGSSPVEPAEGYFVSKASTSLPRNDSLGEVQAPEYEYQLHPGWNIISNPYGCNVLLGDMAVKQNGGAEVPWDTAVTNSWLSNAIYYYEGSDWGGVYGFETTPGATLVPWVGYWVHVNDDTNTYTLVIKKP
jgi:hypothetical protein